MNEREQLAEICRRVYEKEFVAAYDGNLSLRLNSNEILITPSGKSKGEINPKDLIVIDNLGNKISGEGKVSTEVKIHLLAYNSRADFNAVIHAHPIYATAFAAIGETLDRPIFPEVILGLGKVPLCKYATPSTEALSASMKDHISYANAMLLENHGAVVFSSDIRDAYYKLEKLEHTCKTLAVAKSVGRVKILPLLKVKELYELSETTYGIKVNHKNRMDY